MPRIHFDFRTQGVQIEFAANDNALLSRLRQAAAEIHGDVLNLNHVASTDSRVIMQSPTGSTQVEILQGKAGLQTQLFGDFVRTPEGSRRADYMREKLRLLLGLLERSGASLTYLGFTTDARASASQFRDSGAFHRAAVKVAGVPAWMTEGEPCFDFTFRASRVVSDRAFSNVLLNWYQDRSREVPRGQVFTTLAIWDLFLVDQGLQFQYDRNNKAGLFAGKRAWTTEEFVEITHTAIMAAPCALQPIEDALSNELASTDAEDP